MSVSHTSSKRKQDPPHQNKKKSRKTKHREPSNFPPEFWIGLSKVWLTRRALTELERRNRLKKALNQPSKSSLNSPSSPIVTHKHPEDIYQIAKSGGYDLTDIRGYQEPVKHGPTNDGSASDTRQTTTK